MQAIIPKSMFSEKHFHNWYIKNIDKVQIISLEQYQAVLWKYPIVAKLYGALKDFYEIVFSRVFVLDF